ncbi:hypothetical protein Tcur_2636 [Thermomonospora curvata DSM 43183]|uniref:Uncharacterized protein n=1 Tax=Thermomonospora curvata (strain ATCC 19995 / DSM 43183 / JCM 3096 / KCTC 9072 / NBRC 15933 / NCIMB 10081 / Henssen B9) TaxID=471852 RepID=D1A520_THECD|nr:hypothetical protein Tcur_2636 [Thermomonospora curvata DSM 43183]
MDCSAKGRLALGASKAAVLSAQPLIVKRVELSR